MDPSGNPLTHEEIWDDSMLVNVWNEAVQEYQKYHSIEATGDDLEKILQEAEGGAEMPDATSFDQKVVFSALYDGVRSVANIDRGQDGSGDAAAAMSPSHQDSGSSGDPVAQGDPSCTVVPRIVAPEVGNTNLPVEDQELEKQEVTIQPTRATVTSSVDKSRQQSHPNNGGTQDH